jgi:hypothetical protein
MFGEVKKTKKFLQNFLSRAFTHWFLDNISDSVGEETISPKDLCIFGLVEEIRLMGDENAHYPVTILEGNQCSGSGLVSRPLLKTFEEFGMLESDGEREPVAFWDSGIEPCRVAEVRIVGIDLRGCELGPEMPCSVRSFEAFFWVRSGLEGVVLVLIEEPAVMEPRVMKTRSLG